MTEFYLKGKYILAVDDEPDILDTITDILEGVNLDTAKDYKSASEKIKQNRYDLVILDIMGVEGLKLLDEAVDRNIPAIMLTAHAVNPETLMMSIRKGAISYLPKESLSELDTLLETLLSAHDAGRPTWKLLFDKMGDFFNQRFGPNWKDTERQFWAEFSRTYQVSKGIQQRLMHDEKILSRGV